MPLLIEIPSDRTTALYLRVAIGLANTIRKRQLSPGDRLPSVRELATTLKISRNTVLKALKVLKENGLLSAIGGSSVRVASTLGPDFLLPTVRREASVDQYLSERMDGLLSKNGKRILSVSLEQTPVPSPETHKSNKQPVYNPPGNCYMDLRNTQDPRGLLDLRIAIASLLRKNISTPLSSDNLFIFSSRELLLNTLCKLLLEPEDRVVFSRSAQNLDLSIFSSFVETLPFELGESGSQSGIKLLFIVALDFDKRKKNLLSSAAYTIVDHGDVVAGDAINWNAKVHSCTIHVGSLFDSPRSRTSCFFAVAPIELNSILMLAKNQMDRHWSPLQHDAVFNRLRRQSGRSAERHKQI